MVIFAPGKFSLIHRKAGVAITTSPTQLGERIMMLFILAGFINKASVELNELYEDGELQFFYWIKPILPMEGLHGKDKMQGA